MNQALHYLSDVYPDAIIFSILSFAIEKKCDIYFVNQMTGLPQALTSLQLGGMQQFRGISILLETGQTYQRGLLVPKNSKTTYQEINVSDLSVNAETLALIKQKFR